MALTNEQQQAILTSRPDVLAEYNRLRPTVDWNSPWANSHGFYQQGNAGDFAEWWYNQYGQGEGFKFPTANTAPPVPVDPGTSGTGGTGGGGSTTPVPTTNDGSNGVIPNPSPSTDPYAVLTQNITSLLNRLNQQQANALAQQQARDAARNSVNTTFKPSATVFGTSLLDQSIQDILNDRSTKAMEQLDRSKARGQLNDVGYNAGLSTLNREKTGAQAKLMQTADDILNGYRTQYDSLRMSALDAANSFSGTGGFDLSPYSSQIQGLIDRAKTSAPGAFLNALGNDPLFDLSTIRGDAGTAQGALNLKDVTLAEALAKRKKVDSLGRGLGSQGGF